MSSSSAQPDKSQQLEQKLLKTANLIPIYIIEDNLQSNFKRINNFISETIQKHQILKQEQTKLAAEQIAMKNNFKNKLKTMENKIITEINMQLQGRIAIGVGKSIDSFTSKIQERQQNMGNIKDEFENKLKKIKEQLKYQMSMDNQRYFSKEIKRVQQTLKRNIQTQQIKTTPKLQNKNNLVDQHKNNSVDQYKNNSVDQYKNNSNDQHKNNLVDQYKNNSNDQHQDQQNAGKWQQQHHQINSLQSRIQSLQDFSINVDKRIYNGMTSLKESWKQLGEQLLQNKKNLGKKMDELKIDFIKLKSLKQFSIAPDKIQDQFKKKLNQKFTQIYQLLSVSLTKNQYETTTERLNRKINRHDDEFIEIRKQLATNNQFFTFYANNSDQDDLKKQLEQVFQAISSDRKKIQLNFNEVNNKFNLNNNSIVEMDKNLRQVIQNLQNKIKKIDSMGQIVNGVKDRIESLEDFNRFGPDKLDKIHSSLDIDFTATQRQLIDNKTKKQNISNVEQSQRQFRIQLNKMKDDLFLLSSQNQVKDDQIIQMRKNYKQLQNKLQKVKGQNQQAMASRKPWVCLSCDKQQRDKEQTKKQSKLKKPEPFRGFHQQKSQKVLKPPQTPPFQQRFEVYEKLRQKYLSDTIKLPDIFKQKLKDNKDTSFHN